MKNHKTYILDIKQIQQSDLAIAGGKGANLGALARMEGIRVPDAFCLTTAAYREAAGNHPELRSLLEKLVALGTADQATALEISARIRRLIENLAMPVDIATEIAVQLAQFNENQAFAVRSSATAEDLPTASFAGLQDTYLNVIGKEALLRHVRKCWASLFSDRAVSYRIHNRFDHRRVQLAVVIQKMVFPEAAGILFTADPVTGNRAVSAIEAGFGLGEALVSGITGADRYTVRAGRITLREVAAKKLASYPLAAGGTETRAPAPELQNRTVLTDGQLLQLEQTGRRIEVHFGSPQDIEWCLAGGLFYIVQSRPLTTLYPIPGPEDGTNRVYISVGHQQMMTDPIKPLGLSIWRLTAARPMFEAGGRLFVDVAPQLASPLTRQTMLDTLGQSDPLLKDALTTLLERGDFIRSTPDDSEKNVKAVTPKGFRNQVANDPALAESLIRRSEAALEVLKKEIRTKNGPELFDFIREDIRQLRTSLSDPQSLAIILGAMDASAWLNEKMEEWLGEKNAADVLSLSVPHNVTSEMGLALLDVADVIRPYPEIVACLQQAKGDSFLDELPRLEGGQATRNAIDAYLQKYGMRCSGEIDITRTRWSEKPAALLPMILSNVRNAGPGAGKRRFEEGVLKASQKKQELLQRLAQLPEGAGKAAETAAMIDLVRNLAGYREYPKFAIVSRYFVYKQALLEEAAKLVRAGIFQVKEDSFYLSLEEFGEAVRTGRLDYDIVAKRKEAYKTYEKLKPPRVITSEGEMLTGRYKHTGLPPRALAGLGVSSGIIEGRARVILHMDPRVEWAGPDALGPDDILVTAFTDPSWTPLFTSIKGLVTEAGGLMTHGAVIAREYGLPAVVGVENATRLLKDGQRIRVNGTEGYVEIL